MQKTYKAQDGKQRCFWCASTDQYQKYHDSEWGYPVGSDQRLFEKFCLEAFQSGLSWRTILEKRENFRKAFRNFDYEKVARFGKRDHERLMQDAGIVRNRLKIEATINNAKKLKELIAEHGSLAAYVWQFEPKDYKKPIMRSTSEEAKLMAKDLKKRGWKFVGPTTCYSFMQAMGLVNDHFEGCAFRKKVEAERKKFKRPRSKKR